MQTAFRSEERFTQEGFREWLAERPPSEVGRYELLGGRIVMSPPAGWVHGGVGAVLVSRIARHVRDLGLGHTFDSSTGYELPSGDTLEPDVSFISERRFAAGPEPVGDEFLRIVPNLVVEILSRSTARRDRTEKKEIYARCGVEEYWLVDTSRREVIVLDRESEGAGAGETGSKSGAKDEHEREAFGAGRLFAHGPIASRVLPGLEIDVEDLFADLPQV